MSLKAQIDAFNVQKEANLPADVLALMNTTNEELIAQHIRNNALQVGDKVENFILANHLGKNIELADLLNKGPVVVSFYRGAWCPYCNLELKALNDFLPQFKTKSAQLVLLLGSFTTSIGDGRRLGWWWCWLGRGGWGVLRCAS